MVESGTNGVFNATGPKEKLTMGAFLEACRKATGSKATFTWAPEAKLKELGLTPEADFPIWVSTEGRRGGNRRRLDRPRAEGRADVPAARRRRSARRSPGGTPSPRSAARR